MRKIEPQLRTFRRDISSRSTSTIKVDGKWLFTKRKIYNEGRDEWAYKGGKSPAW